jgi:hypothetical protein
LTYYEDFKNWAIDISKYLDKVYQSITIEAKEYAKRNNLAI